MLLGALAEGFGLLMIVPLASDRDRPAAIRLCLRFAPVGRARGRPTSACLLALGAVPWRDGGSFAPAVRPRRPARPALHSDYEASLRLRAAATLAGRGWPFASRIGQAGMQSLLLNDVPRAARSGGAIAGQIAVGAIMLVVQLALDLHLSPALTLVALAVPRRRLDRCRCVSPAAASAAASPSSTRWKTAPAPGFRLHAGLKAALAQGTVPAFLDEYRSTLQRAASQFTHFARDYSFAQQVAAFGAALVAAVLLLVGVRVLSLPFPILAASLVLFARMSGPAQSLQASALALRGLRARLCRDRAAAWTDSTEPSPPQLRREPLDWACSIVSAVSFEHRRGPRPVSGASLELRRGEWLGIAGASGAGKTTLVDLVAGLLAPQARNHQGRWQPACR